MTCGTSQDANSSSGTLNVLSGFDPRNCYGSILVWNNDTVDGSATINITNVPYDTFDVEVYRLDEDHMPGVIYHPLRQDFKLQPGPIGLNLSACAPECMLLSVCKVEPNLLHLLLEVSDLFYLFPLAEPRNSSYLRFFLTL